jgi:hypothetical protein
MVSEHADSTDAAALLVAAGADVNALNKVYALRVICAAYPVS